jgi:hypothetical protein
MYIINPSRARFRKTRISGFIKQFSLQYTPNNSNAFSKAARTYYMLLLLYQIAVLLANEAGTQQIAKTPIIRGQSPSKRLVLSDV